MALSTHRRDHSFNKSPKQLARDAVDYQRTVAGMTQKDDVKTQTYAALQKELLDAKNAGIPVGNLPQIHPHMSPADVKAAVDHINQLRGRQTSVSAARTAAASFSPAVKPAAAPALPGVSPLTAEMMKPQPAKPGGRTAAVTQTSYSAEKAITPSSTPRPVSPAPVAKPATVDPFAGMKMTSTGLQAPATRADGSAMSNPDGTARYVGTLPNRVPATVQSRVLDTGVGSTNARGETPMQTTRGNVVEVDPLKDLSKNWLAKGDPLLPQGADRGVVISPKYGSGVGYATGSGAAPDPVAPKPVIPAPAPVPATSFASIGAPPAPVGGPPKAGSGDLHTLESLKPPQPAGPVHPTATPPSMSDAASKLPSLTAEMLKPQAPIDPKKRELDPKFRTMFSTAPWEG